MERNGLFKQGDQKAEPEEKSGGRNFLNWRSKAMSPTTELMDSSKLDLGIKSSDPYILLSKDTYSEHEGRHWSLNINESECFETYQQNVFFSMI